MPIQESDIKLLKSARMTDTPDGGGRMTGNVVQSGVDNNIFDDVSNLDRVYGNVSLRKVFPAVLTNTTDKFLGSRVIIDEPPEDENIEATLFAASSLFDTRDEAKARVEAYLALGSPYNGLLYGPHIQGMMQVTLLQQVGRPLPSIGEVLVLQKNIGLPSEVSEYIRITSVDSFDATFTDMNGDFVRTVVTLNIGDALKNDFTGFEATRADAGLDYTGKTRVFTSVVANAAQYYGIRKLASAASIGAFNIKADTAFGQLLPSSQIETPLADVTASGTYSGATVGGDTISYDIVAGLTTTQQLNVGAGIVRGTLNITVGSAVYSDNGKGALLVSGVEVGGVDYASGVVALSDASYAFTAQAITVAYKPAIVPSLSLQADNIPVTLESRSLSYVRTLNSKPAEGSLRVDYMSGGKWYTIRDVGSGVVKGDTDGLGAGSVNYTTGTVSVTLGALPDVGSDVLFQWGGSTLARALSLSDVEGPPKLEFAVGANGTFKPSDTITVTWSDGGTKTATLTGGVSSGDGTIRVVTGGSGLAVAPNTLPPSGTAYTVNATVYGPRVSALRADVTNYSVGSPILPGTVRIDDVFFTCLYTVTGSSSSGNPFAIYAYTLRPPFGLSGTNSAFSQSYTLTATVLDDGYGVLYINMYGPAGYSSRQNVGTVDYATGQVTISATVTGVETAVGPDVRDGMITVPWYTVPTANRSLTISCAPQQKTTWSAPASGTPQTIAVNPTQFRIGITTKVPTSAQLRNLSFLVGGKLHSQGTVDPSKLVTNLNPLTGTGTEVGTVNLATGETFLTSWTAGLVNTMSGFTAGILENKNVLAESSRYIDSSFVFRVAGAPLRPSGFSVMGSFSDGTTFNITADQYGKIDTPAFMGFVNYSTGVCLLVAKEPNGTVAAQNAIVYNLPPFLSAIQGYPAVVVASTRGFVTPSLRYNAVSYSYLPLDAGILGLDPVRLPSDGRVPIFKSGRVVVVHNTQKLAAQTVSNGQTVDCGRTLLSRIRVFGNDGLEITTGFTKNLDAGTITFTNVAGMSQPVTIEHRIEDEALCADAQITGDLRLTRPLTHAYPANTSYVSSAYVAGTLQAAAQDAFSQEAWTNVWSDVRIGNPLLAQYNDTDNPLVVTNAGAITERWALIFQSSTTFNVVGENVGLIISGDTATTLAPVNPATGVPYFTLQAAGWGSGWVAGNVLRFNTSGANFPLWVARTVMQSPSAPPGTDQITISVRGDIDQ